MKEYEVKRSKYKHLQERRKLPVRGCILSPASGSKTALIANLILDVHHGASARVYIFSPTCNPGLDSTWDAVRKYVYGEMGTPEEEECFFHEFNPEKLAEVISQAEKVTMFVKSKGTTRAHHQNV